MAVLLPVLTFIFISSHLSAASLYDGTITIWQYTGSHMQDCVGKGVDVSSGSMVYQFSDDPNYCFKGSSDRYILPQKRSCKNGKLVWKIWSAKNKNCQGEPQDVYESDGCYWGVNYWYKYSCSVNLRSVAEGETAQNGKKNTAEMVVIVFVLFAVLVMI